MKKILAILLAVVMCAGLLAACGGSDTPAGDTPANDPPAAGSGSDEPVTLTFWHIWGSGDASSAAVAKVINDFNALDNNITIQVETFENELYKDKIRLDIPGGTGPDIFSSWGGGESRPYVDAGKVLALDSHLDSATMSRMLGGALNNVTYDGKIYGLTFGLAASGFFCNTRLFEENNIKIPETWDELITAVDAFNAAGITPISTSIQERWVVSMLFEGLALKTTGASVIANALVECGDAFGDPGFLDAANRMMHLVDIGAINADANAISRDEAEAPIFMGEAAMLYMGSWAAGGLNDPNNVTNGDVGNFTYIPFPAVSGGNGSPTEFNGGAADAIMINSDTAHKEAAVEFVIYFCENVAREGYLAGSYMPTWNIGQVDDSDVNPIMVSIKNKTASATDFILWWDTFLGPDRAAIYQDALVAMLNHQITPEDFVEQLKTIKPE